MSAPRLISIFAGRFPSEKAAGLFVDLNAKSFAEVGARVTLLAPRRFGRGTHGSVPYDVRYLPTIDLSHIPLLWSIANFVMVYVFAKFVFLWLFFRSSVNDVIISNDAWPLLVATLIRRNTVYEMHDFAKQNIMYRALLRRVRFVLVTNEWKRKEVMQQFGLPEQKVILERNAVDTDRFGKTNREDARQMLGLNTDVKIVMYTGHLYAWKGADTVARAATMMPGTDFVFVGGTPHDVALFKETFGDAQNIRTIGHVPYEQVATWQSAADVLVLPNSATDDLSSKYTSPMKLFEYMASDRPIVASDVPSIREVLPENAGYYAKPDDANDFARAISEALNASDAHERAHRAVQIASTHTWKQRAERLWSRFTSQE